MSNENNKTCPKCEHLVRCAAKGTTTPMNHTCDEFESSLEYRTTLALEAIASKLCEMVDTTKPKKLFWVQLVSVKKVKKIHAIKAVRQHCGLGLKEAKDIVDNVPRNIEIPRTEEEAWNIVMKLRAEGLEAVAVINFCGD